MQKFALILVLGLAGACTKQEGDTVKNAAVECAKSVAERPELVAQVLAASNDPDALKALGQAHGLAVVQCIADKLASDVDAG